MKEYYSAAKLHSIWLKHQPEYLALIDQYHGPVSDMINSTDRYLRMPLSGYSGRSFDVYLEPMIAPGQVNSRNYLQDFYYVVVSPTGDNVHMEALRHTYLHFVLDLLIAKRATSLDRLKPILLSVQTAPMAEEYKTDIGLLVLECLIRAIEARNPADSKMPDKARQELLQRDEAEGFVLTEYFYQQLRDVRKGPDWATNRVSGLAAQYGRRGGEKAGQRNFFCHPIGARGDAGFEARISEEDRFSGERFGQRQSSGSRQAGGS